MHALSRAAIAVFALSTLTLAPAAFAHKNGYAYGMDDDFAWAFVSGHGKNISGNLNSDNITKLFHRYDGEFLYIRDGEERWVITDPDLVDRGHRAEEQIKNYNKEISEIANAEAKFAMAGMNNDKKLAKLDARRRSLEDQIDKLGARGEDTSDLEKELFEVKVEAQALSSMHQNAQLSAEERRDLTERRDRASVRLKKGMQKIESDFRKILSDARQEHLAERVELDD
jgi:chromosome segregation ATPase